MNPSEASRQYQLAVEHALRARDIGQDEYEDAVAERSAAYGQLVDALVADESDALLASIGALA